MEFFTFAWINDPQIWLSLITLSALEIVLGIDNLVFIAILTGRLPEHQRALGRKVGLSLLAFFICISCCIKKSSNKRSIPNANHHFSSSR